MDNKFIEQAKELLLCEAGNPVGGLNLPVSEVLNIALMLCQVEQLNAIQSQLYDVEKAVQHIGR